MSDNTLAIRDRLEDILSSRIFFTTTETTRDNLLLCHSCSKSKDFRIIRSS